ncbi:glycoside hydrolase family 3 N-terminal domain-containing protein [Mangrovivirga cuniculi]|uniref:glycoside hydrolase family 3 N-terminal domain-containing protein n=1 Tax=Mangrovivirga cuniculi TaxID=2715131 RepID=UPI001C302934|nr:glycoside hydrolase family 3 N-terminal domain-containing protein [Mangrovivirga cuniculi]
MKTPDLKPEIIIALIVSLFLYSNCTSPTDNNDTSNQNKIDVKIDSILNKMSIDEKIGQLALRGTSSSEKGALPEELLSSVRKGEIGAFLNVMDTTNIRKLQEIAVNESKHGIPLLFARDVIHGFKTIFPIPLGQAASFNPELVEEGSRIAALEASSVGIRWTFAPMLDICQDSRWGRIAESPEKTLTWPVF